MQLAPLTIGEFSHSLIQAQLHRIVSLQVNVIEDRDIEPLHQLRVSLRRLRCVLLQFEPFLDLPNGVTERRVSRLCSSLGLTRDLDVLQELVSGSFSTMLGSKTDEELDALKKAIGRERKRAATDMKQFLRSSTYLKFISRLQGWTRKPKFHHSASQPIDDWVDELISPYLSALWLHPGWHLDPISHSIELHSLRSKIRRTRYMLENIKTRCRSDLDIHLRQFRRLQELLGDLHDLHVFDHLINESRIRISEKQKNHVLHASHQQQKKIVSLWDVHSRRLLRLSTRRVLSRRISTHPTKYLHVRVTSTE